MHVPGAMLVMYRLLLQPGGPVYALQRISVPGRESVTKYSPARTYGLSAIVYTLGKLLEEKVATYVHELKPHGWPRRDRRPEKKPGWE